MTRSSTSKLSATVTHVVSSTSCDMKNPEPTSISKPFQVVLPLFRIIHGHTSSTISELQL